MENYQIVKGIEIAVLGLLPAGISIFLFLFYYCKRRENAMMEKLLLEASFKEKLLQSRLGIQEEAFKTISREIQDNVGQLLSLAKIQLHITSKEYHLEQHALSEVKESVSKAIAALRDIAGSLNSDKVPPQGLPEMIKNELQHLNPSETIKENIHLVGRDQDFPVRRKLILLRVISEAIQNIQNHSGVKPTRVTFHGDSDSIQIEIREGGGGVDKKVFSRRKGFNLRSIFDCTSSNEGEDQIRSVFTKEPLLK